MESLSYLALGDSYTIGEQVRHHENFPVQTVHILRKSGFRVQAPEIIAVTGFTTDELMALIQVTPLQPPFSLVTLLAGVNNQYRGRSLDNFEKEFVELLEQAVAFAGGRSQRVWVLSIPDWGVTPFAEGRDRAAIAREIDAFNDVCRQQAEKKGTGYIDITTDQRRDGNLAAYLAADGLHPSGKEYAKWAGKLSAAIEKRIRAES